MKIRHDRESGAIYIELRQGVPDHTEDFSKKADVYIDVDAEGKVVGLEALSFDDLAEAISERGGELEIPLVSESYKARVPSEELRVFRIALDDLPDEERKALNLRFHFGASIEEMASDLCIIPGQTQQPVWRALRNLKKRMSEVAGYENVDEAYLETALRAAS